MMRFEGNEKRYLYLLLSMPACVSFKGSDKSMLQSHALHMELTMVLGYVPHSHILNPDRAVFSVFRPPYLWASVTDAEVEVSFYGCAFTHRLREIVLTSQRMTIDRRLRDEPHGYRSLAQARVEVARMEGTRPEQAIEKRV